MTSEGPFGPVEDPEIELQSETAVLGDSRLFTMNVKHKGLSRFVEVELSGTAEAMLDVPSEVAVVARIEWELQGVANDADWTDELGAEPLPFNSKHVEGGIGRTS